ncbi:MAG: phenylalanine--tRNA ligase subunit alpha [Methanotrichaceae archaeon]
MLSESDVKVLKAISEGYSDPQAIASKMNMKIEAVRASADALSEQGLVNVTKSVDEEVSLTEEGQKYAKEGLPESRLLEAIGTGKPIAELKDPSAKIGLGWLKKKNWAAIDKGVLKPTGRAARGKDEEILEALLKGSMSMNKLDGSAAAALKSRGLIESSKSKSWRYEITDSGRKAASELGSVAGTITHVTSGMIKSGEWSGNKVLYEGRFCSVRPYDVTLAADQIYPGKSHPYQRLIDKMRAIMLEMGFTEIKGEIIQSSFWNFDALFQPQDHPAREMQDTFYLDTKAEIPNFIKVKEMHECGGGIGSTGWGGAWNPDIARQEVLRTHTTAVTIHYLADHPNPPVKAFGIDRVYRREAIDATHTPEFEQLEGVIMDKGLTFKHLLGVLKEFYAKMGFEEIRFRPGYFPYTEPSVEPEVFIDGLGWVELGGAGVFRKEVTAPFGIDHPVLAWGLGVSRVAMLKLGLKDLRELYQPDIEWLRKTPISMKV